MRILVYTHAFAPKIGGAETYVMLLAQGLAREASDGLQVTVVTPTPAGKNNDATLPFRVVRQPSLAALTGLVRQADVIHLAGPCLLPMLLGILLGKRVVVEHHGYQAVCPNGLLLHEPSKTVCPGHFMRRSYHKCLQCNATTVGWVKSALKLLLAFPRRWLSNRATQNVPISHHVRSRIGLPRSKVIYYGIPDPIGNTGALAQRQSELSIPTPMTFAYVGRLVSEKGLHLLVEAARRLNGAGRNFRIKFIGDGPERSRLQGSVETFGLGERVVFTGYLQGDALPAALEDVSVLVMTTVMEETAGLAAIEHMMRGRLVIASDIGGLGEVVDGAGLKFAPGDTAGLTSCLERVLDDRGLVDVLGKKARERALQLFLQQRMIAEHLALYRELAGDSIPSPNISARDGAIQDCRR